MSRRMETASIEMVQLTRKFGDLVAVDHLNLGVFQGEIFGLLGPNGAGKTTTINIFTTLIKPSEGKALVMGFDVEKQFDEVRNEWARS